MRLVKHTYLIAGMLMFSFLLQFSCRKDVPDNVPHHDSVLEWSVVELKNLYSRFHGQDVPLAFDQDFTEMFVAGTLISDPAGGNIPAGYLVLQQGEEGIVLQLKDSTVQIPFAQGDALSVNLDAGTLHKDNGNLIVTGLSLSDITKTGTHPLEPQEVSLKALSENFDGYRATLVRIVGARLVPPPVATETYSGAKRLQDSTLTEGHMTLYTLPTAGVAKKTIVPGAVYQGIAMSPLTGADTEQQIWLRNEKDVFREVTLKVMVYCAKPDRFDDAVLDTMVTIVNDYHPDLLLLRQVDSATVRSKQVDVPAYIAAQTGMHAFFSKAFDYEGGAYGNAVLSRFPIVDSAAVQLTVDPQGPPAEDGSLATITIQIADDQQLVFAGTELDSSTASNANRIFQAQKIVSVLENRSVPVILAGNMNAQLEAGTWEESPTFDVLTNLFMPGCKAGGCPVNRPVDKPAKTVDYILFNDKEHFTVMDYSVLDQTTAQSDLPVVATLKYKIP